MYGDQLFITGQRASASFASEEEEQFIYSTDWGGASTWTLTQGLCFSSAYPVYSPASHRFHSSYELSAASSMLLVSAVVDTAVAVVIDSKSFFCSCACHCFSSRKLTSYSHIKISMRALATDSSALKTLFRLAFLLRGSLSSFSADNGVEIEYH